jgi:phage terminase large subunit
MSYMDNGGLRAACVWHRRAGKDLVALHQAAKMAHERKAMYWHCLPTYRQAKKALWDGFTKDGKRILECVFPGFLNPGSASGIVKRKNESEMLLELKCGSMVQLVGSDTVDNLVGAGPAGVTFSEYSISKPRAWDLVRPMLAENGGWANFIYTPRGNNHGRKLFDTAKANPEWFSELLTIYDTGALPVSILEDERKAGMPEALVRQEYLCDWTAALVGGVWGDLLEALEKEGCLTDFEHERDGVYTSWDLGISDSTAIWFWRVADNGVDVVDFYESHGKPMSHYLDELEARSRRMGYKYAKHWLPHDARARTLQTGASIVEQVVARLGADKVGISPELSLADGIQAARWLLQQDTAIHARCGEGIEALKQYHYAYDEDARAFSSRPEHDWSSHCFTGDTEVLTRNGMCRMDMLPSTGEVMTPCGWKPYRSPRLTLRRAPLVEVAFAGGHSVKCTPEHLFLTVDGWRSARDLQPGSQIQSTLTRSLSISMALSTAVGRASAIGRAAARSCIEMCGRLRLAPSLVAATSTTETATPGIITWRTWSACQARSTSPRRGQRAAGVGPRMSTFLTSLVKRLASGIAPKRAAHGTGATLEEPRAGRSGREKSDHAATAARPSLQSSAPMGTPPSGAPTTARPLRIAGVRPLSEKADVWDLTVPGVECFSLANGAVVHNSADAFRYLACVVRTSKLQQEARKPKPPKAPDIRTAHMGFSLDELWEANEARGTRKGSLYR